MSSSTCGLYYLPYTTGSKLNEDPFLLSSSQFSGICRSRRARRPCPTWPPANCDAPSLWVRQCLWKLSWYIVIITPISSPVDDVFSVTSALYSSHLPRYDVNRPAWKLQTRLTLLYGANLDVLWHTKWKWHLAPRPSALFCSRKGQYCSSDPNDRMPDFQTVWQPVSEELSLLGDYYNFILKY